MQHFNSLSAPPHHVRGLTSNELEREKPLLQHTHPCPPLLQSMFGAEINDTSSSFVPLSPSHPQILFLSSLFHSFLLFHP